MLGSKINWYKIADSANEISFADNNLFVTEAGGKKITLAKVNDKIFSCAYKCPHAGAIISEGYIDALGNITCPLHRYKFSLVNGRNISGEGFFLTVYPVEYRSDGIYVGLKSGFSLF